MSPRYDEFEDFDFDDSPAVEHMLRDMQREELRRKISRKRNRSDRHRWEEPYRQEAAFDDFDEYEDYDDEEFDSNY